MVPVGAIGGSCGMALSGAVGWPFPGSVCVCVCVCVCMGGGLCIVPKVESSARAPRLPRFILLVSLSDTLLVVSILEIVYDCHL